MEQKSLQYFFLLSKLFILAYQEDSKALLQVPYFLLFCICLLPINMVNGTPPPTPHHLYVQGMSPFYYLVHCAICISLFWSLSLLSHHDLAKRVLWTLQSKRGPSLQQASILQIFPFEFCLVYRDIISTYEHHSPKRSSKVAIILSFFMNIGAWRV